MDLRDAAARFRVAVGRFSPRHRRWERFLSELTLDPDRLSRPGRPPSNRDFIICGSPRSGTSLLSAVLYQPPSVVTVNEPWDGMRLPPAELFDSIRSEIRETGRLQRGRLDVGALFAEGAVEWGREQELAHDVRVSDGFLLGVKWPAFWRYLDVLPSAKFLVCLRHPADVIGSYKRKGGDLVLGLDYDVAFNRAMNDDLRTRARDPAMRRVLLYDYIHSRILPHLGNSNVLAVRYERWFTEREDLLTELSEFLRIPLEEGAATIHPPREDPGITAREWMLLRAHCRTAEALGYPLSGYPNPAGTAIFPRTMP